MTRKSRIHTRAKHAATSSRAKRLFYQCLRCGALTDPKFGSGESSWCPSCQYEGQIHFSECEIPYPALYGSWIERQKENSTVKDPSDTVGELLKHALGSLSTPPAVTPTHGENEMKIPKYHTGTFHCPKCAIEVNLFAEQVLKCDKCGGRLVKGPLDKDLDEVGDDVHRHL